MASETRVFSADWIPILLSQGVALACGVVAVRFTSELVPPDVYGNYGLFLSFVPLGWMVTHAGLIKHASRHWPSAPDQRGYLRAWLRAAMQPTGLLAAAALLGLIVAATEPKFAWAAAAFLPAALGAAGAQTAQQSLQASRRFWTDFSLTTLHSTTRSFLPLIAAACCGARLPVLAGAFVVHALITAAAGWSALWRASRSGATQAALTFTDYHRAFALSGVLALVNAGVLRWVAGIFFDAATVGQITLASNLGLVLPTVIAAACAQFFFPALLQGKGAARTRSANVALLVYVAACVVAGVALQGILPWLPGRLIANAYAPALPFVVPVFASGSALGLLTLVQNELLAADRPRAVSQAAALFCALFATSIAAGAATSSGGLRVALWLTPLCVAAPVLLFVRRQVRE